ncbi:ribosome-recycling factor, mitochondrial-like [Panonychus citri]|uniref:ribosome-recycling factor, mitochondrial-like n=1 Tax=Panonychus citri TaxID=50023 RepID=UPI002307B3F2|nr:ribosome-recycling factor, mitochondrial-like [Panonychus citri]
MSNLRMLIKGVNGLRFYSFSPLMSRGLRNNFSPESTNSMCLENCCYSERNQVNQFSFDFNCSIFYNQKRYYAKRGITKEKKGKGVKYEMSDEELEKVIPVEEFEAFLSSVYSKLKEDFSTQLSLRSGFGVETISVELDGSVFPLKELAQISKKSTNLMVLNLASLPDAIKPVLAAINSSGMNLSPQQDGSKIFLTLPKITREHRENLAKGAKTLLNSAKQEINQIQNQYIDKAKQTNKPGISQETIRDATDNIRARSQEIIKKCDEMFKAKTKELLDE